jgi:cell division protein FtsL
LLVAKKEMYSYVDEKQHKPLRKNKKNTKSNAAIKVKLFASALMLLCVCLSVLLRYAYITQIKFDVSQLDREITNLQSEKQDLLLELDKIKESGMIEFEAQSKLGMVYPSDEQVVYVSLNNIDEKNVNEDSVEEKSFIFLKSFNSFLDKISNMF